MSRGPRFTARPATAGLIGLCAAVFLVCVVIMGVRADTPGPALLHSLWAFDDGELLSAAGGLVSARVWLDQQWWRVASAGLLHGSWLHLVLNMSGLWVVGQWTEKAWGWWRQLLLFSVSSVGGCLASLAWAEAPMVVGASAGIFGVAGALVVARAWGNEAVQSAVEPISAKILGFWLGLWIVVAALLPLLGWSFIAQAGHIGGLVFGCILGWAMSRPKEQRFFRYGGGLAASAGILGLGIASIAPTWRPNYDLFVALDLLDSGQPEVAMEHLDRVSVDDPVIANYIAYSLVEAGVGLDRADELVRGALREELDANFLDTLGWIQCKQGLVEEGRFHLLLAEALADEEISEISEHLERCAVVGE